MAKIKYVLVFIFICSQFIAHSQPWSQPNKLQQITATTFVPYYFQYNGSPFYSNNWLIGSITLLSNETFPDLKLKYDIYKDEVQYYNEQLNKMLLVDKRIIKKFTLDINGVTYTVIKRTGDDIENLNQEVFYFELVSGKVSLWGKTVKEISEYNDFTSGRGKLGEYYVKQKYYIVRSEKKSKLILSKRLIAKQFPEKRKEILTFIRKNGYNVKNENHLIEVFKKINSLL